MIVTINVTQNHIDKGHACRADNCPIALAMQEQFPKWRIWASIPYCEFWPIDMPYDKLKRTVGIQLELPREALIWMHMFDNGEDRHPFSFQLDIPNSILEA